MSYQLILRPNDPSQAPGPEARELLARLPGFASPRLYDGGQWDMHYENPATGVRSMFSWHSVEDKPGERVLRFELETVRPLFFGIEALPQVTLLAVELGLGVVTTSDGRTIVPDVATLLTSWQQQNEHDVRAAADAGAELNYLPEADAMDWFRYMSVRHELELAVPEGVFAPSIMVVRNGSGELQRIVVWPDAIAQLLPPCEFVLLSRGRTGLADDHREIGAVSYPELLAALEGHVARYEGFGLTVPMVGLEADAITSALFMDLHLQDLDPQHARILSSSQYHTVEGVQ